MGKGTNKVGIVGKYGPRYGSSIRKQLKKIEIDQHKKYECFFCGKHNIKRKSIGIWRCNSCWREIAGGAWNFTTQAALTAKSTIRRLRDLEDK